MRTLKDFWMICYNCDSRVQSRKGNQMASIKKRGNKLYIRYKILGSIKDKATGLDDTAENRERILKDIIPKLKERIDKGHYTKKNKVKHFAEKYLKEKEDLKTYFEYDKRVSDKILVYFGEREIDSIELSEIDEWVASLDMSPKTKKKYIGDFKRIYQLAIREGMVEKNLLDLVEMQKHKQAEINPFSHSDVIKVLSETKGDLNSFFGIAFFAGMRAGEIIALQERDIDFEKMIISIKRNITKGELTTPKTSGSIRDVPILNDCMPYLKAQIKRAKERQSLFLFSTAKGERLQDANSLNALRYLRERGYKNRVHDTRHTFITNMLNSGVIRITDLAQIVGHANTQMIMTRYAKYIKGEHLQVRRDVCLYQSKGTVEGTVETLNLVLKKEII